MNIHEGIDELGRIPPGAVLSIGNFDGMHLGHARILEAGRDLADRSGAALAVVTFEPHPMTVLRPEKAPPRLTPPALKGALLADAGVDELVVLAPTPQVLDLSAEQFWEILRDVVRPAHLVEGHSFFFGKGRGGTIERLREWTAPTGIRLDVIEPVSVALLSLHVVQVSSSLIRWLLTQGRVRDAAICLGRPYLLEGDVVQGHHRGRTIGVPTANLHCAEQLIPADAVYAGRTEVEGKRYAAAVSIGTMPTFGENQRQVEAHLINFDGDLYGRPQRLELIDWLREQRRFDGMEALKAQLATDIEAARHVARDPSRPIASLTMHARG